MTERLLTPSKITSWLGCAHSLTLSNEVESGLLRLAPSTLNDLAEVLIEKGALHEMNCLEDYERAGRTIYEVPGRNMGETFEAWVARVGNPMERDVEVIYQMPFVYEGIRGIADFLVRVDAGDGYSTYEPVDAKLTRNKAKPGHVLQLCFYAEAIGALTGHRPRQMHLWLGSGTTQALQVEEFLPYWRRLRRQLTTLLDEIEPARVTTPKPCDTCEYCEFYDHCESQWRNEDSINFVANSRQSERDALEAAGVRTIVELSTRRESVPDLRDEKLARLTRQAALQVRSRAEPEAPPWFERIAVSEDPVYGHGFELLPEPDFGDVFFDFEGDPFWTPQHDLMFLAGLYYRDIDGEWFYDERWAHSLVEQHSMINELVRFFDERRQQFPAMHVYHYNHTERSTIERLTRGATDENLFGALVEAGLFVDLFTITRNAVRVGTESYGLKYLEHLAGFQRTTGIDHGAGAVVEYEHWMKTQEPEVLRSIARYNRDDVVATLALRDWLVGERPDTLAWRDAVLVKEPYEYDTDELVEALHEFPEDSPEYLLGDLLNYWRRERSADVTPKWVALNGDYTSLYDNIDYLTNLAFVREEAPVGRERLSKLVFTWPDQAVDTAFERADEVIFAGPGAPFGYASMKSIDFEKREITIKWGTAQQDLGAYPVVLTHDKHFRPKAKLSALKDLARQVLSPDEHGSPSRLAMALLRAERPRFTDEGGPVGGIFTDDVDDILQWVEHLDESVVAFQGPPGAGKTFSGSHIIHYLVSKGYRVGVVAMNHNAIDHLMAETHKVFAEVGNTDDLRALRWQEEGENSLDFATYSKKKTDLTSDAFNLIGGTAWLWSNAEMRQYPADVLLVDEAGQLSLADAVSSTSGARNMLLLGDPLQLAQVAKAEHPGSSGASVLEHMLGDAKTIHERDGVFLSKTWRMHPDVCAFISRQIYEGRLHSHPSCAQQTTEFGTGLRWLEAKSVRRSTFSDEEATIVLAQVESMLGTAWTNQHGAVAPLRARDFMVVAPYNDQVNLLRALIAKSPHLHGLQVGTVDKFQGREAPVVFFTMTTSSALDMPRGPEFLFSRNRLNVAVSRARCLAYLVCTEELLNSHANDLDDMRLISTLSAFVEYATGGDVGGGN